MSLRHGILGLLAERPRSGYDLTRAFDSSLADVWPASHSQIYPELARLTADGLIEQVGEGPRGRKVFATTDAGDAEVVRWLRDDPPNRAVRDESLLRGFFLWLLPTDEARSQLETEAAWHRAEVARYEAVVADGSIDWTATPAARTQRIMIESGIRVRRALAEWAKWSVDRMEHDP